MEDDLRKELQRRGGPPVGGDRREERRRAARNFLQHAVTLALQAEVLRQPGLYRQRMSADPKEQEIYQLRKENAELRRSNEILQEALGFFAKNRKK